MLISHKYCISLNLSCFTNLNHFLQEMVLDKAPDGQTIPRYLVYDIIHFCVRISCCFIVAVLTINAHYWHVMLGIDCARCRARRLASARSTCAPSASKWRSSSLARWPCSRASWTARTSLSACASSPSSSYPPFPKCVTSLTAIDETRDFSRLN